MIRHLAPSGAPLRLVDLARWAGVTLSDRRVHRTLQDTFRERFSVEHCVPVRTGRAGLTLLLRALRRLVPDRDEVVLPSYTCFSVAAAVVKAGLRVRLVDVSPETLDFDAAALERMDFSRTLALVATNLYGLPNDLPALERLARRHNVFLIDDAAQAMGARVGGRWCGTWGDAGLFSFDKGKNVSAIEGGVVVTGSVDVSRVLDEEAASMLPSGWAVSGAGVVKALGYFALLRPWLYGIPRHLPGLRLGETVFDTRFSLERSPRLLASLAVTMMRRLEEFNRHRVAIAEDFLSGLTALGDVRTIAPVAGAVPVYLRLPVLMPDRSVRDRVLRVLNAAGIGATGSYPASLADVPALRPWLVDPPAAMPGGRHVASCLVTLPTQPFVRPADVQHGLAVLTRAVRPAAHARYAAAAG
jgi:perosamine synthetase